MAGGRRQFLRAAALSAAACCAGPGRPRGRRRRGRCCGVWSCGGLGRGLLPANARFEAQNGASRSPTPGLLPRRSASRCSVRPPPTSLPGGSSIWPRSCVRPARWMVRALVLHPVRAGHAAGQSGRHRKRGGPGKPGVKVVLAPEASPPGGAAALALLKKAGVLGSGPEKTPSSTAPACSGSWTTSFPAGATCPWWSCG